MNWNVSEPVSFVLECPSNPELFFRSKRAAPEFEGADLESTYSG